MVRSIVAVVVGYIVFALCIFASFSILYLVLGADGSFQAGSYNVSTTWIAVSFVLGLISAVIAGYVCATIAKNSKTPLVFAGIVLVLGLLFAIPALTSTTSPVRDREVGNLEAMQSAKQPAWVHLLNPFLGAVCIVIGARLKGSKPS